jgi:hypothetical protein
VFRIWHEATGRPRRKALTLLDGKQTVRDRRHPVGRMDRPDRSAIIRERLAEALTARAKKAGRKPQNGQERRAAPWPVLGRRSRSAASAGALAGIPREVVNPPASASGAPQ